MEFRIVNGVKQTLDYTLGDSVKVLSVTLNVEPISFAGNRLNFTVDGNYDVTVESENVTYTFSLTLDSTAPTCPISGVENDGIADGIVVIDEPNEESTTTVYFNSKKIAYEFGQELVEYGDYKVIVTDLAGNQTEYSFALKKLLNGGAVALVIIGILTVIGIVIAVVLLRKKGKFGKNKPMKKRSDEPKKTESK